MKSIEVSKVGNDVAKLMDEVARTGQPMSVTKNGESHCEIVPSGYRAKTLFGLHKGTVQILSDLHAAKGDVD